MPDLNTMLQDFASFIEEELPPPDVERLVGTAPLRPVQRRRWARPVLVAAAAALVVLVTIGGPVLLRTLGVDTSPARDPSVSTVTTPSSTTAPPSEDASPTSTVAPSSPDLLAFQAWTPVLDAGQVAGTVVHHPDIGFVMVSGSQIAVSEDGRSWTSTESPFAVVSESGVARSVVPTVTGLLAVGVVCPGPEGSECRFDFWASDDGIEWHPQSTDPAVFQDCVGMPAGSCRLQIDIGSGESGLVAVGFDRGAMAAWDGEGEGTSPQDLVVWESPDGSSWTRTLIGRDQGPPLDAYFAQVVEIPSGWLILAQSMYWDQGAAYRVSLFSSPDGRIWERLDTGDTFENAIVTGVTAGPEGLVAVGGAEGCLPPAAWYSTDGLEWARTDLAKEDCDWAAMKVVHTDVGYLAGIAEGTVWWSPDGRTWTAVEVPVLRDVALHDLSTDGHTIVATGSQDEPFDTDGVWVWPPLD